MGRESRRRTGVVRFSHRDRGQGPASGRDLCRPMLKIALTGGIATGKSYVLDRFRRRGVPCLDADELAHGVTAAGTEATAAIAARFGADILAAGRLRRSREARADRVRRSAGAPRARSDRASGGLPRDRRRLARRSSCSATIRFAVVDVPLLYETGAEKGFDRVIVTACAPETQLARLRERGLSDDGRAPAPRGAVADGQKDVARRFRGRRPTGRSRRPTAQVDAISRSLRLLNSTLLNLQTSTSVVSCAGAIRSSTNVFQSWQCGHCQSSSVLR